MEWIRRSCHFDLWEKSIPDGERSLVAALDRDDIGPGKISPPCGRRNDVMSAVVIGNL
jgi:hypothetical protein